MSEARFTEDEFKEFDRVSLLTDSRDQVIRIRGRGELRALVAKHGKPKCDAMWARIQAEEAARKKLKRKAYE